MPKISTYEKNKNSKNQKSKNQIKKSKIKNSKFKISKIKKSKIKNTKKFPYMEILNKEIHVTQISLNGNFGYTTVTPVSRNGNQLL